MGGSPVGMIKRKPLILEENCENHEKMPAKKKNKKEILKGFY